ncbi:hypothetical protein [Phaffia rhodozyma]|uniref:Uncharacterized protein n=1 Tax=Phaffia rhodozyma TaxID=264483 RepID=A0A0F7SYY7_PHARH|nr:hypothetical protein [Phaffia rhodozyma]
MAPLKNLPWDIVVQIIYYSDQQTLAAWCRTSFEVLLDAGPLLYQDIQLNSLTSLFSLFLTPSHISPGSRLRSSANLSHLRTLSIRLSDSTLSTSLPLDFQSLAGSIHSSEHEMLRTLVPDDPQWLAAPSWRSTPRNRAESSPLLISTLDIHLDIPPAAAIKGSSGLLGSSRPVEIDCTLFHVLRPIVSPARLTYTSTSTLNYLTSRSLAQCIRRWSTLESVSLSGSVFALDGSLSAFIRGLPRWPLGTRPSLQLRIDLSDISLGKPTWHFKKDLGEWTRSPVFSSYEHVLYTFRKQGVFNSVHVGLLVKDLMERDELDRIAVETLSEAERDRFKAGIVVKTG